MRRSVDVSATLPTLMCIYCLVVAASSLHHHHNHHHNYHQQHHNHHSQQHAMREQRKLSATHFFRPLPLQQHFNTGGSSPVSTQGRAAAATGRDLLKKFTMLRNMFQQPQNSNVIIITQPTTTTTPTTPTTTGTATTATSTPTTETTTRNARRNAAAIGRPHGGRLPNNVPMVLGGSAHGIDSKIALDAADGEDDVGGVAEETSYAEHQRLRQHRRKRIRQGMQQIGNLNKTPVRRADEAGVGVGVDVDVSLGGTNDIGNDGGVAVVNRNANKRKRRRKINKKAKQHKNANTNGFANNNKNSNNIKHNNDSAAGSSGSIFDLNTNSRIQKLLMNAFRLQTPVVYNH